MSNKVYDILSFIARIGLPAVGTLYFALASIWGLPYGEQIVGTIVAVTTFLATILQISKVQYEETIEILEHAPAADGVKHDITEVEE